MKKYAEKSLEYEKSVAEWGFKTLQDSVEILEKLVPKTAKIVEEDCGTDLPGLFLYQAGYHNLYGCDLSEKMLAVANHKGIYKDLVQADLYKRLPFHNQEFEAVTCLATSTYVENSETAFREFCRITVNQSILFFSHREDLFASRNCQTLCEMLKSEGLWRKKYQSTWQPYLPDHPAYSDQIKVGYFAYQVLH